MTDPTCKTCGSSAADGYQNCIGEPGDPCPGMFSDPIIVEPSKDAPRKEEDRKPPGAN